MTIVTQLNELAEKMTGTNPRATTDEMALDYIERNYSGGSGGGNELVIEIPSSIQVGYEQIIVSSESTGDNLKLYNSIKQVLESDKILDSVIRVKYDEEDNKFNVVLSYHSEYGSQELSGIIYLYMSGSKHTYEYIRIESEDEESYSIQKFINN